MTAFTAIVPCSMTTAGFQNWTSASSALISQSGLIRQSDYNTIVFSTTNTGSAANSASGFEVWAFNDALQTQYPVYIKVEYGTGGTIAKPGMWLTFSAGFPTDGSGSFRGCYTGSNYNNWTSLRPTTAITSQGGSNLLSSSCYSSGDGSRIQICMFSDSAVGANQGNSIFWGCERTKDNLGNDTTEGIVWYYVGGNAGANTAKMGVLYFGSASATQPTAETHFPGLYSSQATQIYSGSTFLSMVYPIAGNIRPPVLGMLLYAQGDLSYRTPITQTIYGNSHTFLPLTSASATVTGLTTTGIRIAMRWE